MNRDTRRKIAAITGIAASSLILPAAPALAMPARPALILPPSISAKAEASGHLFSRGDYELAMLMFAKFAPSMGGAGGAGGLRPQDVFSTTLYTGDGGTSRALTTNVDILTNGGLAWFKRRDSAQNHFLIDSVRGDFYLESNTTSSQNSGDWLDFTTSGITLKSTNINGSSVTYVNWSLRRAAKFFDIVTYTGNGVSGRQIAHGLGVAPGMVVIKRLNLTSDWFVAHPAADKTGLALNFSSAAATGSGISAQFTTSTINLDYIQSPSFATPNVSGATYVAYLFAHDPDPSGIVQCGVSPAGSTSVNLGWKPDLLLIKPVGLGNWWLSDLARGDNRATIVNSNGAEQTLGGLGFQRSSTGFTDNVLGSEAVYLAIREPI